MVRWVFLEGEPFSHLPRSAGPLANMVVEGRRGHRGDLFQQWDEFWDSGLAYGATPWWSPFQRIVNRTIVILS